MKNPIPTSKLFITPKTEQALYAMLDQYTGEQKALAFQIAMMTMNTCHELVKQELAKTVDKQPI